MQASRMKPVDVAALMTTHLDPINVDFAYEFNDIPSIMVLPAIFISRYVGYFLLLNNCFLLFPF